MDFYLSCVQLKLLLCFLLFSQFFVELAFAKLHKCSAALSSVVSRVFDGQENFNQKVEVRAAWLKKHLRQSSEFRVAPEDALKATRRSFSSESEVKTEGFKFASPLDSFDWDRHLLNLEMLQQFFHGQVDLIDLESSRFRVGIKLPPGPIHPLFFENVSRQIFEVMNMHFEYALIAFQVFKEETKTKRVNYGVPVKKIAEELARAYHDVRERMPQMSLMALQYYRVAKAPGEADSVLDLSVIDGAVFDDFILRDSSYKMLLHEYLKLRNSLAAFESDPEIRREIFKLQSEQ